MAEPAQTILSVGNLRRHYGGVKAVDGATFTVARGSVTSLIGPNGAGKTTAFNLLTGFARPDEGTIVYDGTDVAGERSDRIARRGMVRTFQLTRVLGKMRVLDNVMLAAQQQPGEHFGNALIPGRWRAREAEIEREAKSILGQVGLAEKSEDYAATLSGGQRKLLELARALMAGPRLLMLDEPMAGVNPTLGREILDWLDQRRRERDLTVMFIEHNMDVVMDISDEVIVMGEGRVITQGTPDAVRTDQRVIDAYLSGGSGHE